MNALWKDAATAYWVDDYYTKAHAEQNRWAAKFLKVADDQVGNHANILDTSELLFVAPKHIRRDRLVGNDYDNNGVSGNNQGKATPEVGKQLLQIKLDLAFAQIKRMNDGSEPPVAAVQAPQGGGGGGRGGAGRGGAAGGAAPAQRASLEPTMNTAPASKTATKAPDTVFIDEMTWEETRDAMKGGKTVFIVPTGGTEKNGYHMVMGKHNFIVAHSANLMARRLTNALVAPIVQCVPEGDPIGRSARSRCRHRPTTCCSTRRRLSLRCMARRILFIGDSGGNQQGMRDVARS